MDGTNDFGFLIVCVVGMATVFVMLAVLAAVFRVITLAFPLRDSGPDAALVAAVTAAAHRAYPGARVTRVKEDKP